MSTGGGDSQTSGSPNPEDGAAHAIYALQPAIPDDLREDVLQTEAIALFMVSPDGFVLVTAGGGQAPPRAAMSRCASLLTGFRKGEDWTKRGRIGGWWVSNVGVKTGLGRARMTKKSLIDRKSVV